MPNDLAMVETDILSINEWTTPEELGVLREQLARFSERIREMRGLLDEKMLEIIAETGQDIQIGPIRYYAGVERDKKCRDAAKCLDALLQKAAGDLSRVAECIASDGLKPGACNGLLGDEFKNHFEVIEKPKIKEGKPAKALLSANENFTRK